MMTIRKSIRRHLYEIMTLCIWYSMNEIVISQQTVWYLCKEISLNLVTTSYMQGHDSCQDPFVRTSWIYSQQWSSSSILLHQTSNQSFTIQHNLFLYQYLTPVPPSRSNGCSNTLLIKMPITVTVLYPAISAGTFNFEYYQSKHMPFMAEEFKPYGLRSSPP